MNTSGSLIMMPLGVLYGAVTRARLAAYRSGIFSVSRLPVPVISVGNITTGGTGKTPLVQYIARVIAKEARKVCVLSRGYARPNAGSQIVVSDGANVLVEERQAGDEPFLLARNLVGVAAVVVNQDRLTAGNWAIQNLGTEVFVLDDGFQHLRLGRDLDIVTIDATNPWGGGLLPHGRLREDPAGLSRAGCIVITRTEQTETTDHLKRSIEKLTTARIFTSRSVTQRIRTIRGDVVKQSELPQRSLGAFCGVGNPGSFFTHLEREGWSLRFSRAFPDHHRYQQGEIVDLVNRAKASGASALITTAKDAVKLESLSIDLPCYVLEIEIAIEENDQLVELIRSRLGAGAGYRR